MAARLVAAFGLETLDVIDDRPERLTEVEGIGPVRSQEIVQRLGEQREIKDVMVFLQSHGVSTHYAIKIYKAYGDQAIDAGEAEPLPAGDRHLRHRLQVGGQDRHGRSASSARSAERCQAGMLHVLSGAGGPRACLCAAAGARSRSRRSSSRSTSVGGVEPPRRSPRPSRSSWSRRPAGPERRFLSRSHAAETGVAARIGRLARSQPSAAAADRCRPRPRLVREATERSPRPPAAAGDRARASPQGAGHHRRPRHGQDDAGARHRRRSWRRSARGCCSPPPPAAPPSA